MDGRGYRKRLIVLICGLPNAGKTYYSQLFNDVVHYDEVHARNVYEHINQIAELCRGKKCTCIEGVINTSKHRRELLKYFKCEHKACIWIDTPFEECLKRERKHRKRNELITMYHAKVFEPPTLDEGWDEIIIIRGDNEQRINKQTKD